MNQDVAQKIARYPLKAQAQLRLLRELILEVAAKTPGVGSIDETLKWGEPAYLTTASKSGSTIRIDWKPADPDHVALYFICHTQLVDQFRSMFGALLAFEGDRAILIGLEDALPVAELRECISLALTYHARVGKTRTRS